MKTKAHILLPIFMISFTLNTLRAQSKTIQNLQSDLVKVESDHLDITFETWNKDYVEVKSKVMINLRNGEDNHDLEIQNGASGLVITSNLDTENIEQMVILTDEDGNKSYTPISKWDDSKMMGNFRNMNMGYEINGGLTIYVPENTRLETKTLYGDISIDGSYSQIETSSTYGLIEARLQDVSQMKKASLNSTYDIVDLSLDKNSDATLKLNTTYGSVFSDLPLNFKEGKESGNGCSSGMQKYVLNDGSVAIDIVSTYDNIYVRAQ